jgi:SAM-dependent methyltransferase
MVEFNSNWYDALFNNSNEKKLISLKISELHKNQNHNSFLEIGMGTAPFFAKNLSELFHEYWIVEKHSFLAPLPVNVKYIQDDFENINLEKKFDGILLSHVVYYFSNLDETINKTMALLEDGGVVYFVVNGKDADYGPLKKAFSEITKKPLISTYDILKDSALKNFHLTEHTLPAKIFFNSYEDLYESMRLFFDIYPKEFEENKSEIISWLKKI